MKRDLLVGFDMQQLQPLNGTVSFTLATLQGLHLQSG